MQPLRQDGLAVDGCQPSLPPSLPLSLPPSPTSCRPPEVRPLRQNGLAVDGLSATGMLDRNVYGFADALRAECVPAEGIARLLTDVPLEGIAIAVYGDQWLEGDASRPYAEAIVSKVRASWVVYGDESTTPMVYMRLTAERAEMLAVAGSFSSAMIGAIPPDRLLVVMAIDPPCHVVGGIGGGARCVCSIGGGGKRGHGPGTLEPPQRRP